MSTLTTLMPGFNHQPWAVDALCAQTDPETFYPEKGEATKPAKNICASCYVSAECLSYALTTRQQFGVWGGLSAHERHNLTEWTQP